MTDLRGEEGRWVPDGGRKEEGKGKADVGPSFLSASQAAAAFLPETFTHSSSIYYRRVAVAVARPAAACRSSLARSLA